MRQSARSEALDDMSMTLLLVAAGLWVGAQNAIAGGGSFVTLPALMLTGLDARVANLTSTVAVFPGQMTTALANRTYISSVGQVRFVALFIIAAIGGVLGALLLLATPSALFSRMLPWLVLAATLLFARGAFGPKLKGKGLTGGRLKAGQMLVSIYGGYFGGGIGFLMLALFAMAGTAIREAQSNKNMLSAVMNGTSTAVFAFSGAVHWPSAITLGLGAMAGGYLGAFAIRHVPDKAMKIAVVSIGLLLFAGLLIRDMQ